MEDLIYGAGNKGGGREPQNDEDNLNSKATAKILEVISEGEIAGFATPLETGYPQGTSRYNTIGQKDIFFNRTSLLKPAAGTSPTDDDYNFAVNDLRIDTRVGKGTEADQPVINGFSKIRSVVPAYPNDDLTNANEFKTLTFTDTAAARVSQVVVIISIPALFAAYNNGDVRGLSTHYVISRSISNINNGSFATPPGMSVIVKGRTNDLFQQQHTIDIPSTTSTAERTLQIKVLKINGDHDDSNIIDQRHNVRFTSIVKVIDDKRHYLNSALVGLQLDAENFSSVPKRTYRVKGIKIRIPHGTTVDINTGRIIYPNNYVFNGTLKAAEFCACPVFVLYDILTSRRYGFGDQILTPSEQADFSSGVASNIDLFSFVEASKYANTLVSDRRTNPISQTGTYSQVGREITITFTTSSKLQIGDFISCDFTSGNASDIGSNEPVRVGSVKQNKTVITIEGFTTITTSGNVTVTKGSSEPRFSFNGVINKQEDAFKLLNKVASVFRGGIYFSEGKIKLTQDRPADPVYLFNRSNVTQEGFSYEGSDVKTRSNCVVVRFFNNVTQKVDYVQHPLAEDTDPSSSTFDPFVKAYGLNKKQVDAFGCTSGGQASRLARFIYYSENFLTETCTFTTTSDAGVMIRPGMIISISDPVRSGTRLAGRITAATANQITVDSISGISFTSDPVDKLSVILGDGSMETKDVQGISGSVITVSSTFSSAPNVNSVWLYEKTTAAPTTWRIISVEQSENLQYTVTALTYNSSLYNTIEGGTDVEAKDITNLDEKVDSPSALTVTESLYKHVPNRNTYATNNGNIKVQLRVTWPAINGAVKYKVVYTLGASTSANSNFPTNPSQDNPTNVIVRRNEFELRNVESGGVYVFEVQSINAAGLTSTVPVTASHTVIGKDAPPSDVASLTATIDKHDGVTLNWVPVTALQSNGFKDLDLAGYEIRKGTVWDQGTHPETLDSNGNPVVGSGLKVQATSLFLPLEVVKLSSTFMVKAYDTSGNVSTNATSVAVAVVNPSVIRNSSVSQENGIIKIRWDVPDIAQHTYAVKNYRITYNDGSAQSSDVDTTEFTTPLTFAGTTRRFTIRAVDVAGNAGTTVDIDVTPPLPLAPNNLTHSFTTDSVLLKWEENEPSTPTLQPPVIGYEIKRNSLDVIARVKSTELLLPINLANFPLVNGVLKATYNVAALYLDPSNPTEGLASTNVASETDITITLAPAPTVTAVFDLDNVVLSWDPVQGSIPTLNYGIYTVNDGTETFIETVDTTHFRALANYNEKVFKVRAFSAAYHNELDSNKNNFRGAAATFTSTRANLVAPTKTGDGYNLGSNGGLGFVTLSWIKPSITPANNLGFQDYKIIRSSSATFAGVDELVSTQNSITNKELEIISDAESFKEEVSWQIPSGSTQVDKYYYVIPRDLLNNEGTALQIKVTIKSPDDVNAQGKISEVIDNNVLLRWNAPTVNAIDQLKIDHYIIRKNTGDNTNYAASTLIGEIDGIFDVVFETVANTYTYLIKAVDTAGNESETALPKLLSVSQPPDFVLNADHNSTFDTTPSTVTSASFTNCLKIFDDNLNQNVIYMPVLTDSNGVGTETWATHFTNNSKTTLQGFISANNLNYLEPAPTGTSGKGSYVEIFDYGTTLNNTNITTLAQIQAEGSGTVDRKHIIQLATASGSFGTGVEAVGDSVSRFASGFQRVKYTVEATSSASSSPAGSLIKIKNLNLRIDAKIKNDTGKGYFDHDESSQANGLEVNFNTTFIDVQGINVTPNVNGTTAEGIIAVVDFVDQPNPTSFKVLLYNTNGSKVSGNFTWQCRGT